MKHKDHVIFPRQASARARNRIIIGNSIVGIVGISQFELPTVLQDDKMIRLQQCALQYTIILAPHLSCSCPKAPGAEQCPVQVTVREDG